MKKIVFDFYNVIYKPEEQNIDKDLLDYIEYLYKKGVHLYLFTNSRKVFIDSINNKYNFIQYFDKTITCVEHNKPDQRAYKRLLMELNCKSTDIIIIDDSAENTKVANNLGMKGILYTDTQTLKKVLDAILF